MLTYFVDTETVGFHGVPVLLQYAINDGPVKLYHLWTEPIKQTLALIEDIVNNRVVAHNLRFDWFHLAKFYNMFRQAPDHRRAPIYYDRDQWIEWEWESQNGDCLRPHAAIDTYILAQKGEYQSFIMDSKPIWVRRVPRAFSQSIVEELEAKTELPEILFANRADGKKWHITERKNEETGEVDPVWVDVRLEFAPSNGLKDLARHVLGYEPRVSFDQASSGLPAVGELGYAPFARLAGDEFGDCEGKPTWPLVVEKFIEHWATDENAQVYAEDDIYMLRGLYEHFGSLDNDEDSELAAQVAVCRLRGFAINVEKVQEQMDKSQLIVATAQLNVNSHIQVKAYVAAALDPMEQIIVMKGCDQTVIDEIKNEYTLAEVEGCYCEDGQGTDGHACPRCDGVGTVGPGPMPVVKRVLHVEEVRKNIKRIELCSKLLKAKRLYASFKVIGAKSGRMSGADDLNPQGVDRSKEMRAMFTFADDDWVLSGGDFSSQELSVMATAFHDEELVHDLRQGKSLHGIFATCLDDTKTYEEVMEGKEAKIPWAAKLYNTAKSFVYASSYGGTPEGIAKRLGLEVEVAVNAYNIMMGRYPQMGHTRKTITDRFSSLRQSGKGEIEYSPVETFVESMYGFRRYFDTEYEIQQLILSLIKDMPALWRNCESKIVRDTKKGRVQTIAGAISSALYGGAFSVQNRVIRAALNHLIQSASRTITMGLHYRVWCIQPKGIHPFKLSLMSIHDELQVVSRPDVVDEVFEAAKGYLEEVESRVPLISLEWSSGLKSWADKGAKGVILGWSEAKATATVAA